MASCDDLLAHAHGNRVGTPGAKRADFSGSLEARPQKPQVDAFLHPHVTRICHPVGHSAQLGVVGILHREETKRDAVGLGADDRVSPGEVDVVAHDAKLARGIGLVDGACRVCRDERAHAQKMHKPNGERDLLRRIPLVSV